MSTSERSEKKPLSQFIILISCFCFFFRRRRRRLSLVVWLCICCAFIICVYFHLFMIYPFRLYSLSIDCHKFFVGWCVPALCLVAFLVGDSIGFCFGCTRAMCALAIWICFSFSLWVWFVIVAIFSVALTTTEKKHRRRKKMCSTERRKKKINEIIYFNTSRVITNWHESHMFAEISFTRDRLVLWWFLLCYRFFFRSFASLSFQPICIACLFVFWLLKCILLS